jgi:hypothetical protein
MNPHGKFRLKSIMRLNKLLKCQCICLALASGVLLPVGCSKHPPAATANQPVPTAVSAPDNGANPAPAANPNPNLTAVTIMPAGPDPAPMLAQLTQVLRRFSAEHRQVPKSLNELVAAGYLTALPNAPAGKQFAIEPRRLEVILR